MLLGKKEIVKKGHVKRIALKTFIKNKSGGCRKIRARAADGYSGSSKRNVVKVTENDLKTDLGMKQCINEHVHGRYLQEIKFYEDFFSQISQNLA